MSKEQKIFKVKRAAAGMGLGLFATRAIKKKEFIIEYKGELITDAEAENRQTRYLFEIDDNYTIDGATRDNMARYMNHLCEPNVEAEIEAGEIRFYALRNILEGEELGYDYGEEYVDEFIKPCGCKCPQCS